MVKKKDPGANRAHKERGQSIHRQRLGLLEKHKDYVHRARDYRSKQDRLKKLREKAAFKNKDEFYWGMVKGKTKNGVLLGDRGNEALKPETVKLLKTQDVRYVRMQIARDQKKVALLKRELESLLPASDPSAEWDAVRELQEVEQLASMGIVVQPQGGVIAKQREKGKRKFKGMATIKAAIEDEKKHTLFAETTSDFETMQAGPSRSKKSFPNPIQLSSELLNEDMSDEAKVEREENPDLGWDSYDEEDDDEPVEAKKARLKANAEVFEEFDEHQVQRHRLSLYASLSAHLTRIRELRIAESKLGSQIGLFGKGGARKVQKAGFVDDEDAEEDRNGERKSYQPAVFKYKLPRKQ